MENIEITDHGGIKCDNPLCGWKDPNVEFEDLGDYLNGPCPKCGQNLLTEEDYQNAKDMMESIALINTIDPNNIMEFVDRVGAERIMNDPIMKQLFTNLSSLEEVGNDPDTEITFSIDTHKEITIKDVKITKK